MFRSIRLILVAALLLCAPILAASQAHAGAAIVGQGNSLVELDLHEGALIKLDRPVDTVFVADAEMADVQVKSPKLIYLFGKTVGETTLYAVDEDENVVASMAVRVSHNLTRLNQVIKSLGGGPNVKARSVDKGLVIEGVVTRPSLAADIQNVAMQFINPKTETVVNRLHIDAPNQINLRVRIAEVKRTALKELGFNIDALFELGTNALFGLAIGAPTVVGGAVGVGDFIVRNDDTNSLIASYSNESVAVDAVIDALADEGLLTVLAEPNLTALSGEHADFLAGGEFPIPISQDDGVITIEFKRFGVFLSFMPVVLDNGRISLRVAPEVSELSNAGAITLDGFSIPALTTRKAVTTIELGSGESFAVAGLIQNTVTQSLQKFPGVGDVPVLGQLFRSDNFQRNESELVIIVTPYLVRPSAPQQLVDPTQGIEPPNDEDRYLYGRNYGELTGAASAPGIVPARRRDSGDTQTGFMLD